ncbi:subtilisin-like protein [Roridomyces roridus]|uniref:tripeptidyl-peptidase II n=1 Tax=Roridomyces roridus TaxID=1738132 RepID=A0AAD7BGD2_9AGAR|nr:subtilisin-like protein [Roridomyces roridus]
MGQGAHWIGMLFLKTFHLLALAAFVSASSFTLHDSRSAAPAGFIYEGPAPDSDQLTLRFALAGKNISGLHNTLTTISTPGHVAFRQWLSADEVKAFVKPSSETLAAFENFTSANGLSATSTSPHGNWVSVNMSVFQANTLFRAQYQRFSHPSLAEPLTRTLAISLPSELVGHVDAIHPGTDFSIIRPQVVVQPQPSLVKRDHGQHPSASCNTSDPNGEMTPACLQALYGIPSTAASARRDNRILVTGFLGRSPSDGSLSDFLGEFRRDIPRNTTFNLTKLDNPSFVGNGTFDGVTVEADIDIEYTVGVATGVPVDFLSVGGDLSLSSIATAILDTISFVAGLESPPSIMTTSYGVAEADVGTALATSICNGLAGLSARGISVLFSSGDGGVHGSDDDLSLCNTTTFVPAFPASCPWVTTVGGTIGFGPEIAMNLTSGGFSDVFPRPSYQEQAVESFLAELPKDFPGTFNTTGRGYPDVALQANNFAYVSQGVHGEVSGTSLSAPTFAAIIALVNDRLLSVGEQPLGFLNPWIYKHADVFTGITAGHNSGDLCPESSVAFDAVKGWDPLTGVGTPIFDRLLQAAFAK